MFEAFQQPSPQGHCEYGTQEQKSIYLLAQNVTALLGFIEDVYNNEEFASLRPQIAARFKVSGE